MHSNISLLCQREWREYHVIGVTLPGLTDFTFILITHEFNLLLVQNINALILQSFVLITQSPIASALVLEFLDRELSLAFSRVHSVLGANSLLREICA